MSTYGLDCSEILQSVDEIDSDASLLVSALDLFTAYSTSSCGFLYLKAVSDSYSLTDNTDWAVLVITTLNDKLKLVDSSSTRGVLTQNVLDEIAATDFINTVAALLCAESITSSAAASSQQVHNPVVLELLQQVDVTSNTAELMQNIIDAVTLIDSISSAQIIAVYESLGITDSNEVYVTLLTAALDTLSSISTASANFIIATMAIEDITISDSNNVSQILNTLVSETLSTFGSMSLDGEHYTFVMNTTTKGISEYTNYNFNSMSGNLAASSDGIHMLTDSDDNGTSIEAALKTGFLDFGKGFHSQVPYAYLGIAKDGAMIIKAVTDYNGERKERWYRTSDRVITEPDTLKVKLGKGIKSRYWQFEIANIDGSSFDLSTFEPIPLILKRRI